VLCCELGVVKLSTIHTGVVKMVNMSVADVKNCILQYVNVNVLKYWCLDAKYIMPM
jgi:hypothetical protein